MGDWNQDRWIVQQSIARLKRWIETDHDESRQRKFKQLLETEEGKLRALDS